MTQNQIERHQLGQLIGANKRDHYYELHYSTGDIARLYILADGIFRYFLDPAKKFDDNHSSQLLQVADCKIAVNIFCIDSDQ